MEIIRVDNIIHARNVAQNIVIDVQINIVNPIVPQLHAEFTQIREIGFYQYLVFQKKYSVVVHRNNEYSTMMSEECKHDSAT